MVQEEFQDIPEVIYSIHENVIKKVTPGLEKKKEELAVAEKELALLEVSLNFTKDDREMEKLEDQRMIKRSEIEQLRNICLLGERIINAEMSKDEKLDEKIEEFIQSTRTMPKA